MDIEEGPFETFDFFVVAINKYEVALNNDNNEFKKMIKKLSKQGEYTTTEDKINMQLLSIISMKTKDDLQIGHKKIFTENKIRPENYQEAFKYMGTKIE